MRPGCCLGSPVSPRIEPAVECYRKKARIGRREVFRSKWRSLLGSVNLAVAVDVWLRCVTHKSLSESRHIFHPELLNAELSEEPDGHHLNTHRGASVSRGLHKENSIYTICIH